MDIATFLCQVEPPAFYSTPDDIDVSEKDTVHFKVRVIGMPKPTITWYKENQEVSGENIKT